MQYNITVGYHPTEADWRRAKTTYRDEDDKYKAFQSVSEGNNTEEAARNYFKALLQNGGKIVKVRGNKYAVGIKYDRRVYTDVDVWIDRRTAYCYSVYNFYL